MNIYSSSGYNLERKKRSKICILYMHIILATEGQVYDYDTEKWPPIISPF